MRIIADTLNELTPSELIAWTIAITTVIGALGREVVNAITAWRKQDRVVEKLEENTSLTKDTQDRVIAVAEKAAVIEGHVNSAASTSAEKIQGLETQVSLMHQMLRDQQGTTRAVADAAAAQSATAEKVVDQAAAREQPKP